MHVNSNKTRQIWLSTSIQMDYYSMDRTIYLLNYKYVQNFLHSVLSILREIFQAMFLRDVLSSTNQITPLARHSPKIKNMEDIWKMIFHRIKQQIMIT